MKHGDIKPTILLVRTTNWELLFPIRDFEGDEFTTYNTVSTTNPPLIRYHNWLFWIERYDQPAWRVK